MKYFKKLVGDRIYLSPRNSEDVELFTTWLNDFQVTDYLRHSADLISLDSEKDYLTKNASPIATFVIVTLDGDKMIGTVGIESIHWSDRCGSLGVFIGEAEYRDNGYGTEAIRLLLEYAFHYLNLHSVKLSVLDVNVRAQKCYQKCGFKDAGRLRQCIYVNGKYHDLLMMDILREEFQGDYIRNKNV